MTARIYYYDIGDGKSREEKLNIIRGFRSVNNIPWTMLTPNQKHDWINQQGEEFGQFLPLSAVFAVKSNGLKTGRDAWCCNFSSQKLKQNIQTMTAFYNEQVKSFKERKESDGSLTVDDFIEYDAAKISWDHETKNGVKRFQFHLFDETSVRTGMYRPFCRQHLYFHRCFNQRTYQMRQIFPAADTENRVLCLPGLGSAAPYSCLMTDAIPDLGLLGFCYPFWIYPQNIRGTITETDGRRENITDEALKLFRAHYGQDVAKRDIFDYLYGLFHSPEYKERFKNELRKQLPRVPLVSGKRFRRFAEAGKTLAGLHLLKQKPADKNRGRYDGMDTRITKMRFPSKHDKRCIIYNAHISIPVPDENACRYIINGRSAVEWVMERYQIRTDKPSGIVNDPNDWLTEQNDPLYVIRLLEQVIRLSGESVNIISNLPDLGISDTQSRRS